MENNENNKELLAALFKAKQEFSAAIKDSANPHFKSKFADLESIKDATEPALTKNGLMITQAVRVLFTQAASVPVLATELWHVPTGQVLTSDMPLVMVKQDPQAMGSAVTYARRYSMAALLGVRQTDDDAETAVGRGDFSQPAVKTSQLQAKLKSTQPKPDQGWGA